MTHVTGSFGTRRANNNVQRCFDFLRLDFLSRSSMIGQPASAPRHRLTSNVNSFRSVSSSSI